MTAPAPLAYFHGDDDLMIERAVARFRAAIADGGEPLERWDLRGNRNLATTQVAEVHGRVATAVMFGGGTLVVVTNPGALTVRNEDRDALLAVIPLVAPGNGIVFVEQAPSGGKGPSQAKLAEAVRAGGGKIQHFESPREGAFAAWIESEARDRGLRLGAGAAKELAMRIGGFVREGDADRRDQTRRAAMELDKLGLYRSGATISADDVQALVAEAVPGSAWAFADAVAERDGPRATQLLDALAETMPEPVVVVVLHRRLRELIEVQDRIRTAKNGGEVGRAMGIKSSFRIDRLAEQARRWHPDELTAALDGVLELEAVVKGAPGRSGGEARHRLAFALWIADHVGSSGVRRSRGAGGSAPQRPSRDQRVSSGT
jgi:DNA polymerase III delta subunit